ncbi:MAG: TIGR03790 family protein [Puniceicoccales bacterium]|jgi:uncharacterized protein (TIGR03790 family)|nr:TIGR03790 family protein [Puniceicoccales bacterium]
MTRIILITLLLFFTNAARGDVLPEQTLVLANRESTDSMVLAFYYMKTRGIPDKNLISLPLGKEEEISWDKFSNTLWNPLLDKLVKSGWMSGNLVKNTDKAGRSRLRNPTNKVGYLVLCKDVPLRIEEDSQYNDHAPASPPPAQFIRTVAAVDSELATLAMPAARITSFVPNPLFAPSGTLPASARQSVMHVARLDGPTLDDCRKLVENAVLAERRGLSGRAYVDIGGPHAQGDAWLRETATLLRKTGFDLTTEENRGMLLDYDKRADAPAFYFGWYAAHIAGRFADPKLRFVPGAIALHIHSFSASTLRSTSRGWAGPLVARGATTTFGNVAEPYLELTTIPPLFLAFVLNGAQVGEAYVASTPVWSWQTILIGDPLYKPTLFTFKQQLEGIENASDSEYNLHGGTYVSLRYANLLLARNKFSEAQTVLAGALRRHPSLPLSFALAQIAKYPSLAWDSHDKTAQADIGLLIEIAHYLKENSLEHDATELYALILKRDASLPSPIRKRLREEYDALLANLEARVRNISPKKAEEK